MIEERLRTSADVKLVGGVWRQSETGFAAAIFLLLAALPIFVSGYAIYILPQYLLYGMLAMSLGILWGFVGILSFGQAAFFALGAYAMGLAAKWDIGGNPAYLAFIASIFIGAGLAAVTGGYNGMFVPRMSLSFGTSREIDLSNDEAIYYVVLPVVASVYCLLRWMLERPFGKVLVGIRENEDRVISLGFNSSLYKTAAFALSGAIACLAGAFYGTHANFVSPSLAGVLFSTQVVVWVAIGGRESLLGALLGAVGVAALSNYLTAITPEYWQLVLGIIFVVVIVAFKGGLAGALGRAFRPKAGRRDHG